MQQQNVGRAQPVDRDATLPSRLTFTAEYIRAFDEETARSTNADALVTAMIKRYPTLPGVGSLEISSKVAKGEMQWP